MKELISGAEIELIKKLGAQVGFDMGSQDDYSGLTTLQRLIDFYLLVQGRLDQDTYLNNYKKAVGQLRKDREEGVIPKSGVLTRREVETMVLVEVNNIFKENHKYSKHLLRKYRG